MLATTALNQWLGDLILVSDVQIANFEATLSVTVNYVVRSTNQSADVSYEKTL